MSTNEYIAVNIADTYRNILKVFLIIAPTPPIAKHAIIAILINLKKPDLFLSSVVTEENIISKSDKK